MPCSYTAVRNTLVFTVRQGAAGYHAPPFFSCTLQGKQLRALIHPVRLPIAVSVLGLEMAGSIVLQRHQLGAETTARLMAVGRGALMGDVRERLAGLPVQSHRAIWLAPPESMLPKLERPVFLLQCFPDGETADAAPILFIGTARYSRCLDLSNFRRTRSPTAAAWCYDAGLQHGDSRVAAISQLLFRCARRLAVRTVAEADMTVIVAPRSHKSKTGVAPAHPDLPGADLAITAIKHTSAPGSEARRGRNFDFLFSTDGDIANMMLISFAWAGILTAVPATLPTTSGLGFHDLSGPLFPLARVEHARITS